MKKNVKVVVMLAMMVFAMAGINAQTKHPGVRNVSDKVKVNETQNDWYELYKDDEIIIYVNNSIKETETGSFKVWLEYHFLKDFEKIDGHDVYMAKIYVEINKDFDEIRYLENKYYDKNNKFIGESKNNQWKVAAPGTVNGEIVNYVKQKIYQAEERKRQTKIQALPGRLEKARESLGK